MEPLWNIAECYGTLQSIMESLCNAAGLYRTLHSVTGHYGTLQKRYGSSGMLREGVTEPLQSIMERYKHCGALWKHYGSITAPLQNFAGRYGSVMEHYGAVMECYGSIWTLANAAVLQNITEHCGTLQKCCESATQCCGALRNILEHCRTLWYVTEALRIVTKHYGALWIVTERYKKYQFCPSLIKFYVLRITKMWVWLKWTCRDQKLARCQILMHTNRRTNHPSNNYGDMVIFQFFKMPASCHLEFSNSGNLNG